MPSRRRSPRSCGHNRRSRGRDGRAPASTPCSNAAVAAVEHDGEEFVHESDDLFGYERPHAGGKRFRRDLPVADRPAGRGRYLGHGLRKGERARACHFIELAGMALVVKRRHHHVGDIVGVDEGLEHRARRQRDLACPDAVEQIAFREILVEPAGADDGPWHAGGLQRRLGALRAGLAAARQQHDPLQPLFAREPAEFGDRFGRSLHRQIRLIGDIGAGHAVQRGRPGLRICSSRTAWPWNARPVRVATPCACSSALTRAPVLPVPPMIRIGSCDIGIPFH